MTRWVEGNPRLWYGWTDLGPTQIPVNPPFIQLTDRTTGQLWWLSFNTTQHFQVPSNGDGLGYISINSASPPPGQPKVVFNAYEEPWFTISNAGNDPANQGVLYNARYRLIVDNSILGAEVVPQPPYGGQTDGGQAQIYARQGCFNCPSRSIILASDQSSPGNMNFGWVVYIDPGPPIITAPGPWPCETQDC